jgi:outer membrane protein OmpA-like peptidoglycan-associated protein
MKEEAYRIYWACFDQEAIDMAMKATEKAQALCPVISAPAPPAPPAPPPPARKPSVRIILEDIHFAFDTATLNSQAIDILDRNAEKLKENSSVFVQIEGHACAHGTEEYNMALSERRAQAAKEYLMNKGIDSERVNTIAYGESRLARPEIPTPDNKESPEARANRRVHFETSE